jgi:Rrf2 family protein
MAHIGSGVEYGLHCLLHLAVQPGDATPSTRDLADFQGVSASFVAKVFTRLEKSGLVQAAEGVRGGFRLAREPEEISVLDVVDAIEGAKPLFRCKEIRSRCILYRDMNPPAALSRGICGINAVMLEAESEMRRTLAEYTLADLAEGVMQKLPEAQQAAAADWFAKRARTRSPGRRAGPERG